MLSVATRAVKSGCRFSGLLRVSTVSMGDAKDYSHAKTIYEFSAKDIKGEDVSLEKYRGKVCLIVNVASRCGLTRSNYSQLVELHEAYKDQGLCVLGFPCNQFNGQEPENETGICEFVRGFKVEFDMFAKIDVNGSNTHPLWKWLKDQKGGILGSFIKWNFTKFLIDREGVPYARYGPNEDPKSIESHIKKLL